MDIRRRMFFKKKSSSSGGSTTEGSYTVNLNGQWEKTTAIPNPDSTLYDGVYRSSSNYNINSGVSIMYITIKDCSSFKMYIRSYAESNYDYVMVSQLDKTISGSTSYSDTTLVKAHTRGNQQSGTALSSYTLVEFTEISSGEHTITVVYRKDNSVNKDDDRGYVLISKSNEGSGEEEGGDIEVDTTYSIQYTSSDGNVVEPSSTTVFGANLTNNVYINGVGYLTFNRNVTSIGFRAFCNCDSLTSVTIPNSVTTIGNWAFQECDNLTSVTIPDSVTTIGEYAYQYCRSLTSVNIPDSVTTIASGVFAGCTNLTSATIGDSVTAIGNYAFEACTSLTNVNIPDSVMIIGNSAFYSCESLTSVTIPDSVTEIGGYAFYKCYSLTSVNIGNSVTSIRNDAFEYCRNLTSVTIPDSVTTIGVYAFGYCSRLTSVYCKATTPPALSNNAFFSNGSGRKIYVPTESVEAYKSAEGWSEYASAIVGYNF